MSSGWNLALLALLGGVIPGCSNDNGRSYDFDFAQQTYGWAAGFADYPPGTASGYQFEADYRALPSPLDSSKKALYIAGTNLSDDLFMYYKGSLDVERDATYNVGFQVEFATSVPHGCGGVGGAPGEGVYVKAGASSVEPDVRLDAGGSLRLAVDKGQQSQPGAAALVLGDVANSRGCEEPIRWETKRLSGGPLVAASDGSGRLWLFIGTDSGFEARTAIYYLRLVVRLDRLGSGRSAVTAPPSIAASHLSTKEEGIRLGNLFEGFDDRRDSGKPSRNPGESPATVTR